MSSIVVKESLLDNMKIIMSRKGVDSQFGKQASPILPDGRLLSMPIPSEDFLTDNNISWDGRPYICRHAICLSHQQ